ncbi:MAG: hypothetical protein CMP63_05130 [Flavobacteriales bacterium]|nr:hypothetical protein [Flavobacteriales bacterium]
MKIKVFSLLIILLINQYALGQVTTTIVLQPNEENSKDALISSYEPSKNRGVYPDFVAQSWTVGGSPVDYRSLIEFDLSNIPGGAAINSAYLSLYSHDSPGLGSHSRTSGSNESVLSRITSSWDESVVTWNNQPTTATENQVFLSESSSSTEDYLNIDVTNLVADMIEDPSNSHGFLLKLLVEQHYRSLVFAASGHSDSDLHPKLEVTYTETIQNNDNCITLRPSGDEGKDALISSFEPSKNRGVYPDFVAQSWTVSGNPVDYRSLIEFDLSNIPGGAAINSAYLSLYSHDSPGLGSHSRTSGSNESVLSRITSYWDENAVTWNNQPNTTAENEVFLSESSSSIQDYLNIDVTNLIEDMIADPTNSHGFLFKLMDEQHYRSLVFAASDHSDSSLHPKLDVCYSITTNMAKKAEFKFELFPNPVNGVLNVNISDFTTKKIEIYNSQGSLVMNKTNLNLSNFIDVACLSSGIYFVKLIDSKEVLALKKLLVK